VATSRVLGPVTAGVAASALGSAAWRARKHRTLAALGYTLPEVPAVGDPRFPRLLEALTASPVTEGNTVRVLTNGCRIFPAMLEQIRSARRSVDFATYVYWTGTIAEDFVVALEERARAGVEVNVLLDAVGAAKMDRALVTRLEEAGVTVAWFRPPRWYSTHKLDNRTHRKILVVDGRVGFTGGVGIAEEWTGDCEDPDHWRDTHLRIEGPAVRGLFGGFQENWVEATRTILAGPHLPDVDGGDGDVRAHVTRSSASHGSTEAEVLFYLAIAAARERLWLTSAYFAPRTAFVEALVDASRRGVDVQVLVNGSKGDKEVVRQAGRRSYQALLEGGVRIHEYERTMLHAKIMTVDGGWATVGSINMDNRSMAINEELNLSVFHEGVTRELDEQFDRDRKDSHELELDSWRRRSPLSRVKEHLGGAARQEL
jgi:cardiolipin synthase A/B